MYAQDSIDLLLKSGIDFKRHGTDGIDVGDFGEWLTTSGLVFMEDVTWISFHRYTSPPEPCPPQPLKGAPCLAVTISATS